MCGARRMALREINKNKEEKKKQETNMSKKVKIEIKKFRRK